MDDLLLFTPFKRSHMAKLEDLLKEWIENIPKVMSFIRMTAPPQQ